LAVDPTFAVAAERMLFNLKVIVEVCKSKAAGPP